MNKREDARGLTHLADLERLALLLAVAADAVADDLALPLEAGGNEDLAIAVAGDERPLLRPPEGLPEAGAHRPEVGEEGARVAPHQGAGEGEGRHAGDLDQPVSRFLLGAAEVRVFVSLVEDQEIGIAGELPAMPQQVARDRVAAGFRNRLKQWFLAGLRILPPAAGDQRLESREQRVLGLAVLRVGALDLPDQRDELGGDRPGAADLERVAAQAPGGRGCGLLGEAVGRPAGLVADQGGRVHGSGSAARSCHPGQQLDRSPEPVSLVEVLSGVAPEQLQGPAGDRQDLRARRRRTLGQLLAVLLVCRGKPPLQHVALGHRDRTVGSKG